MFNTINSQPQILEVHHIEKVHKKSLRSAYSQGFAYFDTLSIPSWNRPSVLVSQREDLSEYSKLSLLDLIRDVFIKPRNSHRDLSIDLLEEFFGSLVSFYPHFSAHPSLVLTYPKCLGEFPMLVDHSLPLLLKTAPNNRFFFHLYSIISHPPTDLLARENELKMAMNSIGIETSEDASIQDLILHLLDTAFSDQILNFCNEFFGAHIANYGAPFELDGYTATGIEQYCMNPSKLASFPQILNHKLFAFCDPKIFYEAATTCNSFQDLPRIMSRADPAILVVLLLAMQLNHELPKTTQLKDFSMIGGVDDLLSQWLDLFTIFMGLKYVSSDAVLAPYNSFNSFRPDLLGILSLLIVSKSNLSGYQLTVTEERIKTVHELLSSVSNGQSDNIDIYNKLVSLVSFMNNLGINVPVATDTLSNIHKIDVQLQASTVNEMEAELPGLINVLQKSKINSELPPYLPSLVKAINSHEYTLFQAPTGCGKSTLVPLALFSSMTANHNSHKQIFVCQPTRPAVMSIAKYVAELLGQRLQDSVSSDDNTHIVGYAYSGHVCFNRHSRIVFCTAGFLWRWLYHRASNQVNRMAYLLIDEVHVRNSESDLVVSIIKQIKERNSESVKVILCSATMDSIWKNYFHDTSYCQTKLSIKKNYDVIRVYSNQLKNIDTNALRVVHPDLARFRMDSVREGVSGIVSIIKSLSKAVKQDREQFTVLVFVPGEKDVYRISKAFTGDNSIYAVPLCAALEASEQYEAIYSNPVRGAIKLIVATNIAETSLTISDCKVIIDQGLEKRQFYYAQDHASVIEQVNISEASALQREGRVGRCSPGLVIRCYNEEKLKISHREAELERCDLSDLSLSLLSSTSNEVDVSTLYHQFLLTPTPPPRSHIEAAIKNLVKCQALIPIDSTRYTLTYVGRFCKILPTMTVENAVTVLRGARIGCGVELLIYFIASSDNSNILQKHIQKDATKASAIFQSSSSFYRVFDFVCFNDVTGSDILPKKTQKLLFSDFIVYLNSFCLFLTHKSYRKTDSQTLKELIKIASKDVYSYTRSLTAYHTLKTSLMQFLRDCQSENESSFPKSFIDDCKHLYNCLNELQRNDFNMPSNSTETMFQYLVGRPVASDMKILLTLSACGISHFDFMDSIETPRNLSFILSKPSEGAVNEIRSWAPNDLEIEVAKKQKPEIYLKITNRQYDVGRNLTYQSLLQTDGNYLTPLLPVSYATMSSVITDHIGTPLIVNDTQITSNRATVSGRFNISPLGRSAASSNNVHSQPYATSIIHAFYPAACEKLGYLTHSMYKKRAEKTHFLSGITIIPVTGIEASICLLISLIVEEGSKFKMQVSKSASYPNQSFITNIFIGNKCIAIPIMFSDLLCQSACDTCSNLVDLMQSEETAKNAINSLIEGLEAYNTQKVLSPVDIVSSEIIDYQSANMSINPPVM